MTTLAHRNTQVRLRRKDTGISQFQNCRTGFRRVESCGWPLTTLGNTRLWKACTPEAEKLPPGCLRSFTQHMDVDIQKFIRNLLQGLWAAPLHVRLARSNRHSLRALMLAAGYIVADSCRAYYTFVAAWASAWLECLSQRLMCAFVLQCLFPG